MRYFKGYSKEDPDHNAVFALYEKPQKWELYEGRERYIIEASYLDKTSVMRFSTIKACKEVFHICREIGEVEYKLYQQIQRLLTEINMSGYTGGYPRNETVKKISRRLPKDIEAALKEIENNESLGEKANILDMRTITNIEWDTDAEDTALPESVQIPADIPDEEIADYISDIYGYCIKTYAS